MVHGCWPRLLAGPVRAVGFAVDLNDDGPFDETIQEGHGQGAIGEIVGPAIEVDVGNQGGGAVLVSRDGRRIWFPRLSRAGDIWLATFK